MALEHEGTYLNDIDHLLRFILPALIGHQLDFLLEQRIFLIIAPVDTLNQQLFGTGQEQVLELRATAADDFGKVVVLAPHTLQHLPLE